MGRISTFHSSPFPIFRHFCEVLVHLFRHSTTNGLARWWHSYHNAIFYGLNNPCLYNLLQKYYISCIYARCKIIFLQKSHFLTLFSTISMPRHHYFARNPAAYKYQFSHFFLHTCKIYCTFVAWRPRRGERVGIMACIGNRQVTNPPNTNVSGFMLHNKRRLLALCSDKPKSRKFQLYTGLSSGRCPRNISVFHQQGDDAARVVNVWSYGSITLWYHILGNHTFSYEWFPCWCIFLILAWASRCRSYTMGNARASACGTTTVEFHVFYFVSIQTYLSSHSREFLCSKTYSYG